MGASVTIHRRLDWADTDAAGYWHHSTFWTYAEAGEAALVRAHGLSDLVFGHTPRKSVTAEFHRPVYFDDEVAIVFTIERLGTTSATYHVRVEHDGELCADGTMVVVLTDDEGRPRAWPEEARSALTGPA